jgi:hypothetical protein
VEVNDVAKILLIHWNREEAEEYAAPLRQLGHELVVHSSTTHRLDWPEELPHGVVISLDRLPSHGREIAEFIRSSKKRAHVPIVFVGGKPDKVAGTQARFPNENYCTLANLAKTVSELKPPVLSGAPKNVPASAGYSATPLVKKLGIKEGMSLFVVNPPEEYWEWLRPLPKNVRIQESLAPKLDFIHAFFTDKDELARQWPQLKKSLAKTGILWISWPKKASKVPTNLDENFVRELGLAGGLVDTKICAVDAVWSGHKFVFRRIDR